MTALAESILRKIAADVPQAPYLAVYERSACIDGWVEDLTAEEVAYLLSLGWPWDGPSDPPTTQEPA